MPQRLSLYHSRFTATFLCLVVVLLTSTTHAQMNLKKALLNSIGMKFVLIPAGTFKMGAEGKESDEKPVHQVTISRAFYLGKFEVTQSQWQAVMGNNPAFFSGEADLPVESVWWTDAQAFIKKLNEMEGSNRYRLPTEAEWEYAARAGSSTDYSFGNDPQQLRLHAWYKENAGGKTHPVGKLKSNAWGLHDMLGNVWEWVQDWYGRYPSDAVTDPQEISAGTHRMRRGCGWNNVAEACRTPNRYSVVGFRDDFIGFRVLRTIP